MKKIALLSVLIVLLALSICSQIVAAEDPEEDPVLFVINPGATEPGGTGWYAGYVVIANPGTHTYTLDIYAVGPDKPSLFPVHNIVLIATVSDAAQAGGITSIVVNTVTPTTITSYTPGTPSYYLGEGGVFKEPDYYGYNDLAQLPNINHPFTPLEITVTITFAPDATSSSKVLFLAYGTDNAGKPAKTPFSGGTLFVLPEYSLPGMVTLACFGAFVLYKKRGSLTHLKR